jgi:hypothetical protein
MRKIEIIELVKDYLAGGDATDDVKGRYHDEIIANHLSTAYKRVVFDTWLEAKQFSDYSIMDVWATEYDLVQELFGTDQVIVTLPYPPIQLPNAKGILQVVPIIDNGDQGNPIWDPDDANAFAYRETASNAVFAALEVSSISTRPNFYLELKGSSSGQVAYILHLQNIPDTLQPGGSSNVRVKMIVPFEVLDLYDEVALPAGKEDMMVRNVIELLSNKPPEDEINDSKANQI